MQDCAGASPPQTCTLPSPRPPREIIARERQCQLGRRAPNPAFHNIIPSELCNSRRHPRHPPGGYQLLMGQKPAETAFQPGEAAADKRPPSRTSGLQARQGAAHFALPRISVSGYSSSAPPAGGTAASDFRLEARIKGRRYVRAQSAGTSTVSASPPSVSRWEPRCSAGQSAALGASLGVGPAPPVVWQDEPATPLPAPFLRGTASPC